MDEIKKLSIVVEHWIEHNQGHIDEYQKWAQKAGELGLRLVKIEIEEAAKSLSQSNEHLKKAVKAVRFPLA